MTILGIGDVITEGVQDFFYSLLWQIIQITLKVVDEIQNAFYILASVNWSICGSKLICNGCSDCRKCNIK